MENRPDVSSGGSAYGSAGTSGNPGDGQSDSSTGSTTDLIREQVSQGTQQAQEVAGNVAHKATAKASSMLESQKDTAAQALDSVAITIQRVGDDLRGQGQNGIAGVTDNAADKVQQLSGYLRAQTIEAMISDTESFARRRPGVFYGGAFLLGLLASRFLKSSPPGQNSTFYDSGARYGSTGSYNTYGSGVTGSSYGSGATGNSYESGTTRGSYGTGVESTGTYGYTEGQLAEPYESTEGMPDVKVRYAPGWSETGNGTTV